MRVLIVIAGLVATACSGSGRDADHSGAADLVLRNAAVYTVNTEQVWAEAVAIRDGVIVDVGTDSDVSEHIDADTRVVDLGGRMLLPGFIDAHSHPLEGATGFTFFTCGLEPGRDPESWIEHVGQCSADQTELDWVLGGGHSVRDLIDIDRMPKEILDDAVPDRPVALMEGSSHSYWVNSAALVELGITADTPDPPGGVIVKHPRSGEPTGLLLDSAGDNAVHAALPKTPQIQALRAEALDLAQRMLAENGITSVTVARVYWQRGNLDAWLDGERDDRLTSRTVLALWTYPDLEDTIQLATLKEQYRDDPDSLLRISQIKFYSDGLTSNNTAAVLQPYTRLIHEYADPLGLNYFDEDRLTRYITELERVGFDVHIHAIGDRAVRESLNAIEAAQVANPGLVGQRRHQLTHTSMIHPDDLPRFAQLGVVPNVQSNFQLRASGRRPGRRRSVVADSESLRRPLGHVYDSGARLVLSSDWDVATMSPFRTIHNLANGRDQYGGFETVPAGKHAMIEVAIRGYTLNAAYVMQQDDRTGSIEAGKYADLVVTDRNLFEVPPEEIDGTRVLWTLLGGEEVHRAEGFEVLESFGQTVAANGNDESGTGQ